MKAPFEKFQITKSHWWGNEYVVKVEPYPGNDYEEANQIVFIETAIRNELARTANTQEGKA